MKVKEIFVRDRKAIAVTSMVKEGDTIYCGLTGGSHAIAAIDNKTDDFKLCAETFPWVRNKPYCTKIHNSLCALGDGTLLGGECSHFTWDGLPVYNQYLKSELPDIMLYRKREQGYEDITYSDFALDRLDDWNRLRDDPGGKIVRYDTKTDTVKVVAELPKFCYSQSMVADPKRGYAYVNTIPDNHFVVINYNTGEVTDHGRISEYGHHNMVVAPNGCVYGGWMDYYNKTLKLLKYDPETKMLYHTDKTILRDVGNKVAGNQGIDQWIVTKSGEMYVGTVANSLFFHFDWKTETFTMIGQAALGGRVATVDEDEDGCLWLGAGYPDMHLVKFDPKSTALNKFVDYGAVSSGKYRCYFHSSCIHNGKIYLGETDGFTPSVHIIDLKTLK